MTDVLFPPLDQSKPNAEGVLATWYAEEGANVDEGQLLAEVQVDKVDAEVVAPTTGVLHHLAAEDDPVAQGTPIGRIE